MNTRPKMSPACLWVALALETLGGALVWIFGRGLKLW